MITGKLLAVLAVVIVMCVALSGLVGWGVANATLSAARGKSVTGASGATGEDGSNGKDGATGATGPRGATGATGENGSSTGTQGQAGAAGAAGLTGAIGARGLTGLQGAPGPAGANGKDGKDGASAPSFATTSASGVGQGILVQTMGVPIGVLPAQIPAGPALVGFTVVLTDFNFDFSTCSLVDTGTGIAVASAATLLLNPGTATTVSTTQVVTLDGATTLQLQCSGLSPGLPVTYSGLSVYAISFAPQG
jgi:hypothetical protein